MSLHQKQGYKGYSPIYLYKDAVALLGKDGTVEFGKEESNCKKGNYSVLGFIAVNVDGSVPEIPIFTRKQSLHKV